MGKAWPALEIGAAAIDDASPSAKLTTAESLAALLDDYSPAAIEDLATVPLPADGLWDPTFPPLPEPPPAPLHWRVFFQSRSDREAAATR